MKLLYFRCLFAFTIAALPSALAAGESVVADEPIFDIQEIFDSQRFPSVVVGTDGTVMAFRAQNAPMAVRRSEDGGETWGPIIQVGNDKAIMGAAIVDEGNGDILAFNHFDVHRAMYRSKDHGKTWQTEETTIKPDLLGGVASSHGSDSGITLQHGPHKGRLILPARVLGPEISNDRKWWPYHYSTAIYSDDHGKTWHTSHPFPVLGTGEAAIAELSDGTIIYNSRMHMATDARRRIAYSKDGGDTWINPRTSVLPDGPLGTNYGCMGGLIRIDHKGKDVLIYSNLDEPTSERRNLTIWVSTDGGETWPVSRVVYDGPAAYSSMAAGRPGTASEGMMYLMFEGGPDGIYDGIHLARFNMAWVLGEDQKHADSE